MALGRRGFLTASGAVATGGFLHAASAKASSHPVAELGIIPDTGDDLSEAFQKAIAKLSEAGQTVYLPGGTYNLHDVALPKKCVILGVPGQTRLVASGRQSAFSAHDVETLFLSGLIVEGSAIAGNVREATIENLHVTLAENPSVALTGVLRLNISHCQFEACSEAAIEVSTSENAASSANLTGNLIKECKTGIALAGSGHVTGNNISGATDFGLRLGGGHEGGTILADGNIISDCGIGIGVAANEEAILVSLNMINGLQGKTSKAIRAFNGEDLIGPDLAFESAESYLNLTVVGNVAR